VDHPSNGRTFCACSAFPAPCVRYAIAYSVMYLLLQLLHWWSAESPSRHKSRPKAGLRGATARGPEHFVWSETANGANAAKTRLHGQKAVYVVCEGQGEREVLLGFRERLVPRERGVPLALLVPQVSLVKPARPAHRAQSKLSMPARCRSLARTLIQPLPWSLSRTLQRETMYSRLACKSTVQPLHPLRSIAPLHLAAGSSEALPTLARAQETSSTMSSQ
jgi:hypothetical protein